MNTEIEISMENDLFHTNGRHTLCIPAYSRSANVVDYQIAQSYVGALEVKADRICVTDWLGFVRIKSKCNSVKEYKVFPSGTVDVEADMTAVSQGMNEAEESRKKGHDFSEVVDVREYQPGDKLQNIHWKLSAKKDVLMVKDRESMSSSQLMILVELADDETHILNDVLKSAYGMAVSLLDEQLPFTFYYWSGAQGDIVRTSIDSRDDLAEWMEKIFYEQAYADFGYGLSMLEKNLDSDRRIIVVSGDMRADGNVVFTYGDRVKGYIIG
mgnify:FL=1